MAAPQRDESLAADWVTIRGLSIRGEPDQAIKLAEQLIAEAADPFQAAPAFVARLIMLYNTGRRDTVPPLLKQAEEQVYAGAHPRLLGLYHTMAATIAYDHRAYGVALLHIINAERALARMSERTRAAVDAWHDLAMIHSRLGYHAQALQSEGRAQSLSKEIGQPAPIDRPSLPILYAAVYLDQRGDTDGCVRQLTDLVEHVRPKLDDLDRIEQVTLGYAIRRLAALHRPCSLHFQPPREVGPVLHQINTLADVCDLLAAQRPEQALALLDAVTMPLDALGVAEPLRLRSLALAQLGDLAGALDTERAAHLLTSQEERDLRTLLIDSTGARVDQDRLRRAAEQHARAALTDPLTGLPNRRRLDEFTATLATTREHGAIGMLDLDRFKAVNDTHGHPTGDIVLQRIAGILARELQPTDLLARTGGDEFVIVLPGTSKRDAENLGEQLQAAVRTEDWATVLPDTPVGVSSGWAELDTDIDAAIRAADNALYKTKREHRAHPQP